MQIRNLVLQFRNGLVLLSLFQLFSCEEAEPDYAQALNRISQEYGVKFTGAPCGKASSLDLNDGKIISAEIDTGLCIEFEEYVTNDYSDIEKCSKVSYQILESLQRQSTSESKTYRYVKSTMNGKLDGKELTTTVTLPLNVFHLLQKAISSTKLIISEYNSNDYDSIYKKYSELVLKQFDKKILVQYLNDVKDEIGTIKELNFTGFRALPKSQNDIGEDALILFFRCNVERRKAPVQLQLVYDTKSTPNLLTFTFVGINTN